MTGNSKKTKLATILESIKRSPMCFEVKKTSRGAVLVVSGIMSIGEFTQEHVILLSHSGRLELFGDSLSISVFENRIVEVYGRIMEVKLFYGKT